MAVKDNLASGRMFQPRGGSGRNSSPGDQVFVAGSVVSTSYERSIGNGNEPASVKLTSWQIRANTLRKLNRAAKEPEAVASGSREDASAAPF